MTINKATLMTPIFAQLSATQKQKQNHNYYPQTVQNSLNNVTRKGWTREQFVTHIETRLTSQNMRKNFLKDTEIRNLAKLLGITPDKILNLNRDEYRALCKKFHPDTCKIANGDACFRIINILFKLK